MKNSQAIENRIVFFVNSSRAQVYYNVLIKNYGHDIGWTSFGHYKIWLTSLLTKALLEKKKKETFFPSLDFNNSYCSNSCKSAFIVVYSCPISNDFFVKLDIRNFIDELAQHKIRKALKLCF